MTTIQSLYNVEHDFTLEIVTHPIVSVSLIDCPENPLQTLALLTRGYKGIYELDHQEISEQEILKSIVDMNNTRLQTPLEFIYTVWLLNDVPRSFTHQLVRTRIGVSFVQESMRFLGHRSTYKVLVSRRIARDQKIEWISQNAMNCIVEYEQMLNAGIPSEDARAILPTDILTNIYMGISLNTLRRMYEQRMCCQAQQGIWQDMLRNMKNILIEKYGTPFDHLLSASFERGEECGYRASFDRPCIWGKK